MEKLNDGILGLCIGEAMGVPFKFKHRRDLSNPNDLYEGKWSAAGSLSLCELDSLSTGLDYKDMMNKFVLWSQTGLYSSIDKRFDIGIDINEALYNYLSGIDPIHCGSTSEHNNGNEALIRMLPVLFYLRKKYTNSFFRYDISLEIIDHIAGLTHNHISCKIACLIYVKLANNIIEVKDSLKNIIKITLDDFFDSYKNNELEKYKRLYDYDKFLNLSIEDIYSDRNVIHSLEAVLYILGNTNSFLEAISKGAMLGNDSDSICSIIGSLAGLYYGLDDCPNNLINNLKKKELIDEIVKKFE